MSCLKYLLNIVKSLLDPEARNALLVVDPVHGQAAKSGQGHTTKRARRGHGVHHRVRAQVAVVGQADQDLGNGQGYPGFLFQQMP